MENHILSVSNSYPCRGCYFYELHEKCTFEPWRVHCPCVECLVKVMCRTTCKDFDIFNLHYINSMPIKEEN
jgi:hypothetical protein